MIAPELLNILNDERDSQGYVKAGFMGFAKAGKSYTATMLACAIKTRFKLPGPIGMFDTETGSVYLKAAVKELTGQDLLARRSRSFDSLMEWAEACVQAGVSVAIVDSITHPWRELCDSYLAQVNEWRARKGWNKQKRLEFQDWNAIKPRWAAWTDFYLNSPLHLIICGRAGWEYEMENRDDGTNKKDLVKTGVKMKTETEFGFEPSLLVHMERDQDLHNGGRIIRTATVLGDRFAKIDGQTGVFPSTSVHKEAMEQVYQFFQPHLDCLTAGVNATVDTNTRTDFAISDEGDESWTAEKKQRTIQCEEIQGELMRHYPGQSASEKQTKMEMIERFFGTRSWTKVESMSSDVLKHGLQQMRLFLAENKEITHV